MKKLGTFFLIIFLLVVLSVSVSARPTVFVSVFPLYDVVKLIGGEAIELKQLVPHGVDAHGYEPSPRRIADLEKTDLFFYIGLGFEPWAEKAVINLEEAGIPAIKVSEVVSLREIEKESNHHNHDHDHDDDHHHHGPYDPHIWLDFDNMIKIGELVKEKITQQLPDHEEVFKENFSRFETKIKDLDEKYLEILSERNSDYILTSHAAFGYLADRFGLKEISVSGISPHAEPSPHNLSRLVREVKEHDIRFIFLETLASPRTAEVLAEEADLEILTLNPIEGLTREEQERGEDYFSLMEKNLENLRKALVKQDE